jgi:hypothetical protein
MKRLTFLVIGVLITANLVVFVSLYEPKTEMPRQARRECGSRPRTDNLRLS